MSKRRVKTVNFSDFFSCSQQIDLNSQSFDDSKPTEIWMNCVGRDGSHFSICMSPEEAIEFGKTLYKMAYSCGYVEKTEWKPKE